MPKVVFGWGLFEEILTKLDRILKNQEEILDNQRIILTLLYAMKGGGLSNEDRVVMDRAINRLEALAAER